MLHRRLLALLAIAPWAAGCASVRASGGSGDLVVGAVQPLSGQWSAFGQSAADGIRMAIDERNLQGGVAGRRLVLRSADSRERPDEGAQALARMLEQARPAVVIGDVRSSVTLALVPLAERHRVPLITPAATNPRITAPEGRVRPWVFRACIADPYQGTAMARFARERLGLRRVAILRERGRDYSFHVALAFQREWERGGGTVALEREIEAQEDFAPALRAVSAAGVEAIFLPVYYTEVARIARQARALGMKHLLLGSDSWDSSKLYEQAGEAVAGSLFINHHHQGDPAPGVVAFYQRYRSTFGKDPDVLALLGYDAARMAFAALERSGGQEGEPFRAALEQTRGFAGVDGPVTLGPLHDAIRAVVVERAERDGARFHGRVEPVPDGAE